ncbi:MAG: MBL fold metallo-hydrolase [Spirochaetaceae bacterium]|nr:MBL fold metallo-hydrolase [Spirochaetaceae bacterium]MDT8299680.1 MBL fold metallo-hydrolase [Spirochaetaceae bacterium]
MSEMKYELTLLGTGTSIGIPVPGCECRICRSFDHRNRRNRTSALLRAGGQAVLIDTAPEFRLQALSAGLSGLDAVFWTHGHADHLHGLDDLRALTWKRPLKGYASSETIEEIRTRFDYLWKETQRGGGKAKVILNTVEPGETVNVGPLEMIPIPVRHGDLRVFGWRCGPIAYVTDASEIPEESYPLLEGLSILVVGALRFKAHPTHFSVERALEEIKKIRPKRAYLTHISHEVSHRQLMKATPRNVWPARDGLRLRTSEVSD